VFPDTKISQGKNWARNVYLAWFLLALLGNLKEWPDLADQPILATLIILLSGIQAYALFLIFSSPGKEWFTQRAQHI
jgi:hypothetical protein